LTLALIGLTVEKGKATKTPLKGEKRGVNMHKGSIGFAGLGLAGATTSLLIALKLLGVLGWSWFLVLAPLGVTALVLLVPIFGLLVIGR
jgi:hypothetical protein